MENQLFDSPEGDQVPAEDMKIKPLEGNLSGTAHPVKRATGPMIYKKILDIQEEIPAILKNRSFVQGGKEIYKFRGVDDLYNALSPLFKKHRVFMTPEILSRESTEKTTQEGKALFYEKLEIKYRMFAEDGSQVEGIVVGVGMDSGDKAANKAMSVAQKYFLIQVFNVPTDEKKDPEEDGHEVSAEELNEVQQNVNKAKTMQDLRVLYDSYPDLQKSQPFITIMAQAKARIQGGGGS